MFKENNFAIEGAQSNQQPTLSSFSRARPTQKLSISKVRNKDLMDFLEGKKEKVKGGKLRIQVGVLQHQLNTDSWSYIQNLYTKQYAKQMIN